MQLTILGAGAIGCLCAHALAPFADVLLVCRRAEQAAAIADRGLAKTGIGGPEEIRFIRTAVSGDDLPPADLVLLCVKNHDTGPVLAANPGISGPATVVVSLQNGLGHDAVIGRFIPAERTVIGTIRGNSRRLDDRSFRAGGAGEIRLGGPQAEAVAALFRQAGFDAGAVTGIQPLIWEKLFINLAINPLTALHRVPNGRIVDDPALWQTAAAVIREAVTVAAAEGMTFDEAAVLDSVGRVARATAADYSSMEQDLEHGRRTEIDALNGALTALAARHGLTVPVNARLTAAVQQAESAGSI